MKRRKIKPPKPAKCFFCQNKQEPDWRHYQKLAEYLSPRGRILPRAYTGLCAKHQRRLTVAVKRARHLGLLPFVVKAR